MGILRQKSGSYEESIEPLSTGLQLFPESDTLSICLGISYMNMGKYEKALACFLKYEHSKEALPYIITCHRELGNYEKERAFREKLEANGLRPSS